MNSPTSLPQEPVLKFLILGIHSDYPTLPNLYCRYLPLPDDASPEEKADAPEGECFSTFDGTLPDPYTRGLEPIVFASLEAAKAHIATEIAEGSNWTYALWPAPAASPAAGPCYALPQQQRASLLTQLHNVRASLLSHPSLYAEQGSDSVALSEVMAALVTLPPVT